MIPKFEMVKKDAMEFLKKNFCAVIATAVEGQPYVSTVYYVVDDLFTFYFVTQPNTNKYMNISRNTNVAIAVGTGPEHISVTAQGKAEFLFDADTIPVFEKMIDLIAKDQLKKWPIRDMAQFKASRMAVFKITPERLTFMNLDDQNYSGSMSDRYVTIIP